MIEWRLHYIKRVKQLILFTFANSIRRMEIFLWRMNFSWCSISLLYSLLGLCKLYLSFVWGLLPNIGNIICSYTNAMERLSLAQASLGKRSFASIRRTYDIELWAYSLDMPFFFSAVNSSRHFVIAILSDS